MSQVSNPGSSIKPLTFTNKELQIQRSKGKVVYSSVSDTYARVAIKKVADHINQYPEILKANEEVVQKIQVAVGKTLREVEMRLQSSLVTNSTPEIHKKLLEDKQFIAAIVQAVLDVQNRQENKEPNQLSAKL